MYDEERDELTEDALATPRVKDRFDVVFGDDEDQDVDADTVDIFEDEGLGFQAEGLDEEDEGSDIN